MRNNYTCKHFLLLLYKSSSHPGNIIICGHSWRVLLDAVANLHLLNVEYNPISAAVLAPQTRRPLYRVTFAKHTPRRTLRTEYMSHSSPQKTVAALHINNALYSQDGVMRVFSHLQWRLIHLINPGRYRLSDRMLTVNLRDLYLLSVLTSRLPKINIKLPCCLLVFNFNLAFMLQYRDFRS